MSRRRQRQTSFYKGRRIKLDKDAVEAAFAQATDQGEYLLALYRMVWPEWDQIEAISGYPAVNDTTWKALCKLAMDADQRLGMEAQNVMVGGAWMNRGFSTPHGEGQPLPDWTVSLKDCTVTMKAAPAVEGGAA